MDLNIEKDLKIERLLNVSREKIWSCWTTPEYISHFFIPSPHRITHCEINLKVGGKFNTTFEVDGNEIQNHGVYLDIIDQEKLVFTDAYTEGWQPTEHPFLTVIILLEDLGIDQTKYTVIARHWTAEARQGHENMGFQTGWNIVIDQLEQYAQTL